MESGTIPLLYFCSIAGLVMVVGGIWLIAKEKILIDRETKEITSIELPFGVKLRTNLPALALFVLGFVPLIHPLSYITVAAAEEVQLSGEVTGNDDFPVEVYAVVRTDVLRGPDQFNLSVPLLKEYLSDYKVHFVIDGQLVDDGRPDVQGVQKNGVLKVDSRDFSTFPRTTKYVPEIEDIPAEFAVNPHKGVKP